MEEDRILNIVTDFEYTQDQKDAMVSMASMTIFADITVELNGEFIGGHPRRHK